MARMRRCDYPPDWKQIVARVLERAGHQCERCRVPNGALGYRTPDGTFHSLPDADRHQLWKLVALPDGRVVKLIRIILTTAHIGNDHPAEPDMPGRPHPTHAGWHTGDKHNKRDACLATLLSLCQRCHLAEDHKDHVAAARKSRLKKHLAAGQQTWLHLSWWEEAS